MLHILKNPSVAEYAVGAQKKKLNLNLKSSLSGISISSIATEARGNGKKLSSWRQRGSSHAQ